jgi:hypothetical protein
VTLGGNLKVNNPPIQLEIRNEWLLSRRRSGRRVAFSAWVSRSLLLIDLMLKGMNIEKYTEEEKGTSISFG